MSSSLAAVIFFVHRAIALTARVELICEPGFPLCGIHAELGCGGRARRRWHAQILDLDIVVRQPLERLLARSSSRSRKNQSGIEPWLVLGNTPSSDEPVDDGALVRLWPGGMRRVPRALLALAVAGLVAAVIGGTIRLKAPDAEQAPLRSLRRRRSCARVDRRRERNRRGRTYLRRFPRFRFTLENYDVRIEDAGHEHRVRRHPRAHGGRARGECRLLRHGRIVRFG